ncbi:MAG: Xenobiotic-transporting ATPase, partial [Solirubrobacterales bacterium]|nr:Xenobiotic-transporting ATPase [Solirubrobacterales bacterium]
EASILEAMARLMKGRTTFMIAHRLGTLEGCDVHVELQDGRLVETKWAGPAAEPRLPVRVEA